MDPRRKMFLRGYAVSAVLFVAARALVCEAAAAAGAESVRLAPSCGALASLAVGGRAVQLMSGAGGFGVRDAKDGRAVAWSSESGGRNGADRIYDALRDGDLRLHAEFVPGGGFVRVNVTLTNLRSGERGFIVDYSIPLTGSGLFSNSLNDSRRLDAGSPEVEGNVYPIATLAQDRGALAAAIPPDSPCIFGMTGGSSGLTLRFYLGASPLTKTFPNQARFSFIVFPVERGWEFRRALASYYSFFPDYYEVRTRRYGYLMFGAGTTERPDMDFYALNRVALGETLETELQRDDSHGIASVVYTNAGTQELTDLPALPRDLDEAWKAYQDICGAVAEEWTQGGSNPTPCELIESSSCGLSGGKYVMSVRYTGWGHNSISFKTNPNPALFAGTKRNIGDVTLKKVARLFEEHPSLDGVCVDSLGANWPATLNYRKDHFEWARYPLTVGPGGRPALHNQISFCEYLDALRALLRPAGRILYGNGIYTYRSNWTIEPEHYRGRGVTLGRFFMAARVDVASSEAGVRANQDRFEFVRAAMGRKLYSLSNSEWDDIEGTRRWFNRCLLYTVFGENVRKYNSDPAKIRPYHPDGYARDREMITWFMRNVRLLADAGWEPVTGAAVEPVSVKEPVLIERYGSGRVVYLAVMNDGKSGGVGAVRFDRAELGLPAGDVTIDEIAQGVPVRVLGPDRVELPLEPSRTCILRIRPLP